MPIQFRCLSCGTRIVAEDEEAGTVQECEKCGLKVTVPQPIGGKLTEKRLGGTSKFAADSNRFNPVQRSDPLPIPEKDSKELDAGPADVENAVDAIRQFDPANVPQYGFEIQVKIENEVYGRTERLWVEDCAEYIRVTLLNHLDKFPQYFDRGFLLLNVNRWSIKPDSYDINLRLAGLVNGEEFSEYFYATPTASEQRSFLRNGGLITLPVTILVALITGGASKMRGAHLRLRKKAARKLQRTLDLSAGRPIPFLSRVWTFLNSDA